jgi:hypothetical protein
MQNCEYVQQHYGVPACVGRRVVAYGKPGVIAEDRGHHIGILLDGDKPNNIGPYHPVDGIVYLDEKGKVRKPSRFQARYGRYLEHGDGFDSFLDFCRWDAEPERSWNGGRA